MRKQIVLDKYFRTNLIESVSLIAQIKQKQIHVLIIYLMLMENFKRCLFYMF